jgi:multiple sugar transport system permease protein
MRSHKAIPYLFLLPSLIIVTVVMLYPVSQSFVYSFYKISLAGGISEFAGLQNYFDLTKDAAFLHSVQITLYFMVVSITIQTALALVISLSLNERIHLTGFFRTVILIVPWAVTPVVNGLMWRWIFDPTYGALNGVLAQLGLIKDYILFFNDPNLALHATIVADAWSGTPFMALMFFAAIQGVPRELYDAAMVDGASAIRRFFHITWPTIRPVAAIVLVVKLVWQFRVFDIILAMTEGGPGDATRVITYYTWENIFKYANFGYGATLSWAIAIISTILAITYLTLLNKVG